MRAVAFDHPGPPEVLTVRELPIPQPREGELLVRLQAAGVNGADLALRSGRTPSADGTNRPGLEGFGTVAALGPRCDSTNSPSGTSWREGDAVCVLVAGGAYAEYVTVPVDQCLAPPKGLSPAECGGVVETAVTVWDNVFLRGRLKAGETFLVHGGASGIGTTAIQLARERGARVFATAGSEDKCAMARSLGAEACFDYKREDFSEAIVKFAGGADVILDVAGGGYLERNLKALKTEGRLVTIALQAGTEGRLDMRMLMNKRASVMGSILKTRTVAEKRALLADVWREVWPLYEAKRMKVVLGHALPLAEAARAHALMESGASGKTVLLC